MSNERTGVLELTLGDSYIGSAYSPQVEVTDTPTGHEVAITYMSPEGITTERFDVEDGETGPQGPAGFSPTVTITDTPTGHTVTITDAQGQHSYDVPNYAQEEQERQDAWNALSGEVTDAITAAESATSAASTAATSATSAATSATSAAQAATTAASGANTAASSANAAATAANSAASAAGTAADAATTAAGDATDAAAAANTAAEAAQEAATEVAPEVAWLWGNQLTDEVTGDILTASDAYGAPPMALTVDGRSTQDGTPTPDAPVPIESVDELTLAFAGKNLLPNARTGRSSYNPEAGTTFNPTSSAPSGTITDNGDGTFIMTALSGWAGATLYTEPLPSGTYHIKAAFSGSTPRVSIGTVRARDMTFVGTPTNFTSSDSINKTYTFGEPHIITVYVGSSSAGTVTITQPQLELGSTATAYEPYEGHTVSLYDGTLRSLPDGTKDELALTYLRPSTREGWAWYSASLGQMVGHIVLTGTSPFNINSFGTKGINTIGLAVTGTSYTTNTNLRCDRYVAGQSGIYITSNGTYIGLTPPDGITDMASFNSWLANNNVSLDYPLATPVTHDLGEVELPVLPAPTCTVWSDPTTGLAMEYVQDANLVVSSLSAETAIAYASIAVTDGPTATANHTVGTYLTMGGTLYKVTQAIAVGETIAAGTNVTATTVMAELIARTA